MDTKGSYIFSVSLMLLMGIAALFSAVSYTALLFLFGMIMMLLTQRSLLDRTNSAMELSIALCFALFTYISGTELTCFCFYECRKNKLLRPLLPPLSAAALCLLNGHRSVPYVVMMLLIAVSGTVFLFLIERVICSYIGMKTKINTSVSVTAVSELYSKKLNQELVIKNYLADRNARLEERENISRSIHNSVGHTITAAIMTLEAADMLFDTSPEKAREKMKTANERIRSGLDSIRHAVRVLDSEAAYVSLADLASELSASADGFMMDTMRKVYLDLPNEKDGIYIPREHTEFLTGAMQELLTNGVRHGGADVFFVHLFVDSCHVRLTVLDNGKSNFSEDNASEKIAGGFGLKKLTAYAKRCGGAASFENKEGFKSEITLPYEGGQYGAE